MASHTYDLNQSPLYRMSNRRRLAHEIFNVELAYLQSLAAKQDNFHVFNTRTGGKDRVIECPKSDIGRMHGRLFLPLSNIRKPEYLHSGVPKRSYVTNAMVHATNLPLVKLDICKFYDSLDGARVFRFFSKVMCCSPDVAGLLTKLATFQNRIPKGSCISQLLAFFSAKPMFDELASLAELSGLQMTCYVDDITFSGDRADRKLLSLVQKIVLRHGLRYHHDHCYAAWEQKLLTGVMVSGSSVAVPPVRELRLLKNTQLPVDMDPWDRVTAFDGLLGRMASLSQIEERFKSGIKKLRRERSEAVAIAERICPDPRMEKGKRRAAKLRVAAICWPETLKGFS